MNANFNRRGFLKAAAVGATAMSMSAHSYARIMNANERIRLAQIGCGGRGIGAHMMGVHKHDKAQNVEYVAVSDPWRVAREKAAALCKEWYGQDVKQFVSYRDIMACKDVDAVLIASPDHHHATQLEAAAKAKKHVYVEKPMARSMHGTAPLVRRGQGRRDRRAGRHANPQPGHQHRLPRAVEIRRAWARLRASSSAATARSPTGITSSRTSRRKTSTGTSSCWTPRSGRSIAGVYSGWYGYLDYTDGPIANLGCHFIDLYNYITGVQFPTSCVCNGGVFTWKDEHKFTCPDHVEALWVYPEGFMVAYSSNFGNGGGSRHRYFCEKGQLILDNWSAPTYSAEGGPKRDGGIRGVKDVKPIETPDHFLDWLQCMRTGKPTRAPIEAGYQHSVACLMAVESYNTGRRTTYDPKTRTIGKA